MASKRKPTVDDARLILELYDLRREPEMRKARDWCTMQFFPRSYDDVAKIGMAMGTDENRWLRQFLTYYEMVASFVNRGLLDRDLLEDSAGEYLNVYAKLKPYLAEMRKNFGIPEFIQHIERLVEESPTGRRRLKQVEERIRQRLAQAQRAAG
jgi:hypothetical protein